MVSHVATVPDDVLSTAVLQRMDCVRDLCALASTSKRFHQLSGCDTLWKSLWASKWGEPVALTRRAAVLAGGFKALFGSKTTTDKASAPWTKPCPEELKASIEKLTSRTLGDAQQVSAVFLVDGSGSVNAEEFEAMLGFVMEASTQLKACVADCQPPNRPTNHYRPKQVSVVQFSNDVRVEAPLAAVDLEALKKITREMMCSPWLGFDSWVVRMNGGTNVAVAVQKAGQLLKRDAAPDAMRHVVLLTDGRVDSYQAHEARQMAEQLADEQRYVTLFAYGVGRGVDRAELLHIIGGAPTSPLPTSSSRASAPAAAPAVQVPSPAGSVHAGSTSSSGVSIPSIASTASSACGVNDSGCPGCGAGGRTAAVLSALGEAPEDRYLALCVRDEAPW
ncbi:collagen-related protein [Volvox carteri f. nagariensis]|uniref:Collagen-related protein n=1 Tax=Volvox carteri f. nagariensis TaxID=3068 RepID=D8TNW6_VOLCA|nr:collagen-related protein [Volvox carteri f. nagariensis]EFJ51063.1 collagen-related protein [Volvox carteri f. nagariensis]|eukprot:XP_002948075.1 collagen-related protein [Volvox carteri f. nagariensis]